MSSHSSGFYGRLARWVMANPRLTIAITVLVTVLSALSMTRLRIDNDLLALMPEDAPSTKALKRLDIEEGGANVLTIAVEAEDTTKREAFLVDLEGRLEALPDVDYVIWRLDPGLAWHVGLLQVPLEDLTNLRDRLRAALQLGPAIANPFIAARVLDLGPLTDKLASAGGGFTLSTANGVTRMLVRPKGSAHDIPFARVFMHEVEDQIAAAKPEEHGVTIRWLGGPYRHNVEDYEGIVHDIGWITGSSFVLVLLIIAFAFRTPKALAAIFVPLLISNVWTLGIAAATVGSLNTFTSFVNAVLIGIGVEFGVHIYARYRELRAGGDSLEDAVVRTWDLIGGTCTSACLTSSAGFAALLVAHFAGFRQLGWLLALGLVLCLVAVLVLTPLVIKFLDHKASPHSFRVPRRASRRRLPASYRLAPMALLIVASMTMVSALLIRRIQPEFDLSELRRAGLAYDDLTDEEKSFARDSYSPLIVSFPDDAALAEAHARLSKRVTDGRFPEVARVLSVHTLLPEDQAQRVAILTEIADMAKDPNAIYLPPQVQKNLAKLHADPARVLSVTDLPESLQHVLGGRNGAHRLLLVPAGNMWDMREASKLADAVERELPNMVVAGEYLTLGTLYQLMLHDAPRIGFVALLLVTIFTFNDLRSLRGGMGAMAVLFAGMAWWGALLALSDIRISIVNFVGIPIVLGIGIDVMIHLIHRMKQEGPGRILKSLATTGFASALGTSTTVVAFAALSLASSQGIRSLGLLVLLGESAVTIAGFVLVPLGFATQWRLQGRALPPDED